MHDEFMFLDQYAMLDLKRSHKLIFVGVLCCLSGLFCLSFRPLRITYQLVSWTVGEDTVRGTLWLPETINAPLPAVLLVHGVMSDRDTFTAAGQSLAQSGVAALSFDFRGYGDSDGAADTADNHQQDLLAAILFLRSQAIVKADQLTLVGHSMGATTVAEISPGLGLQASYGMGMEPQDSVTKSGIQWLTGLYDSLHPPSAYAQVWVSATANHHTEPIDLKTWQKIWSGIQRDLPGSDLQTQGWWRFYGCCLLGLGVLLLLLGSGWFEVGRFSTLLGLTLSIAALAGLGYFQILDGPLAGNGIFILLLAYLLSGVPTGLSRPLLLAGLLIWSSREGVAILRTLPHYLAEPQDLGAVPVYLLQSLIYPLIGLLKLKAALFTSVYTRLEPSFYLPAVLMLEWLFPGWWCKNSIKKAYRSRSLRWSGFILGLALLFLSFSLFYRYQQGYLYSESLNKLAGVLFTDILPTFVLAGVGFGVWHLPKGKRRPRDDSNVRPTV